MSRACQSYTGRMICRDGFPERHACRTGEGRLPHCLNPDFFTTHLHTDDGRMLFARAALEEKTDATSK